MLRRWSVPQRAVNGAGPFTVISRARGGQLQIYDDLTVPIAHKELSGIS